MGGVSCASAGQTARPDANKMRRLIMGLLNRHRRIARLVSRTKAAHRSQTLMPFSWRPRSSLKPLKSHAIYTDAGLAGRLLALPSAGTLWRHARGSVLDQHLGRVRPADGQWRQLERSNARNEPKNLIAAPFHYRPHACVDGRAVRVAVANPRHSPTDRGPRAGCGAARLGGDLRQGVRAGGQGRTGPAHALRQIAVAAFL